MRRYLLTMFATAALSAGTLTGCAGSTSASQPAGGSQTESGRLADASPPGAGSPNGAAGSGEAGFQQRAGQVAADWRKSRTGAAAGGTQPGAAAPSVDAGVVGVQDATSDPSDPRRLKAHLIVSACDADPRALVREEPDAVVIGGFVTKRDGVCIMVAEFHPVELTLTAPLNGRTILDAATGLPVPVPE